MLRRFGRRSFLGASAAICLGCTGDSDDGPSPAASPTAPPVDVGVEVGPLEEVVAQLDSSGAWYVPEARGYVVRFPAEALDRALATYDEALHAGLRAGFVGVFQRCPHLGCRVPFCESSGWFECPCHAGRFNGVGEYQVGLPERGLDLLPVRIVDGVVVLDQGPRVPGVAIGDGVVVAEPTGPYCIELSESG